MAGGARGGVTLMPSLPPGGPRTETRRYALPSPRERFDDARDIAARVLRDDVSVTDESVILLCEAIEALDMQLTAEHERLASARLNLAIAQGLAAATQLRLSECRSLLTEASTLRQAALEDAAQQRAIAVRLSAENRQLRFDLIAITPVRVATPSRMVAAYAAPSSWDTSDLDTVVCDPPVIGGAE